MLWVLIRIASARWFWVSSTYVFGEVTKIILKLSSNTGTLLICFTVYADVCIWISPTGDQHWNQLVPVINGDQWNWDLLSNWSIWNQYWPPAVTNNYWWPMIILADKKVWTHPKFEASTLCLKQVDFVNCSVKALVTTFLLKVLNKLWHWLVSTEPSVTPVNITSVHSKQMSSSHQRDAHWSYLV